MNLELFHKQPCPFSAKVRNFIESEKLMNAIQYRDVEESNENKKSLEAATGDVQVPCLMVDGNPLLESAEIITFLKKNKINILRSRTLN